MLNQMKMETRLHAGFGAIVLLVVLLGIVAFAKLTSLHDHWTDFETITLARKNAVLEGVTNQGYAVHHFKNYILRGGDNNVKFRADLAEIDKEVANYRAGGELSAEEQQLLADILAGTKGYAESMSELEALREKGATPVDMDKAIKGADAAIAGAFRKLLKVNDAETKKESEAMTEVTNSAKQLILAIDICIAILGCVLAVWLARSLSGIVREVQSVVGRPGQRLAGSQRHRAIAVAGVQRAGCRGGGDQRLDRADDGIDRAEHRERQDHRRHRHPGRAGGGARRRGGEGDGGGDEADRQQDQHLTA
jgi:methyl-accepting chemotaxis protein